MKRQTGDTAPEAMHTLREIVLAELGGFETLSSAGAFGTFGDLNWWKRGGVEAPTPFRGDVDLYFVLSDSTADSRAQLYRRISAACAAANTNPVTTVSFSFAHGPYKPEYRSSYHFHLHCILDERELWTTGCNLFRWGIRDTSAAWIGRPLANLFDPVAVTKKDLLTADYGVNHLLKILSKGRHRLPQLARDGRYYDEEIVLGKWQLAEMCIFSGTIACRRLLQWADPMAANSEDWLSTIGTVCPTTCERALNDLLSMRRAIRMGRPLTLTSAQSLQRATHILISIKLELEEDVVPNP